jgi:hypothetical protein
MNLFLFILILLGFLIPLVSWSLIILFFALIHAADDFLRWYLRKHS